MARQRTDIGAVDMDANRGLVGQGVRYAVDVAHARRHEVDRAAIERVRAARVHGRAGAELLAALGAAVKSMTGVVEHGLFLTHAHAALLGAPAIIVSEGGVGRPIDEIVLNASHFASHGVRVAGAIVNKVDLDAQPGIVQTLERGLAIHDIPLLGVLPYRPILSNPTLAMILEGVHGETVHPGPDLDRVIGGVKIGAMEPAHMLERIQPDTLVIVPGDREDVILTLTTAHLTGGLEADGGPRGAALGLVLTGGYRPRQAVLDAIRRANLFASIVPDDTYVVASEVHDLLVKTHSADAGKIEMIKALVWEHLQIDRVLEAAGSVPG